MVILGAYLSNDPEQKPTVLCIVPSRNEALICAIFAATAIAGLNGWRLFLLIYLGIGLAILEEMQLHITGSSIKLYQCWFCRHMRETI